jgi:hypothetical protein
MTEFNTINKPNAARIRAENMLEKLPPAAKQWAESLPWHQRRYVLSLCHLICAAAPETQAEFLDYYTADGLVSRMLCDRDTQQRVQAYLRIFRIQTKLNEFVLKSYVKQFYIHSAQDTRRQPDLYLESALRLSSNNAERNSVFNYILGFELCKMMFRMSWAQHERLASLQKYPTRFIKDYIKPIQHTHKINRIVVPKNEKVFFDKHDYFVHKPNLTEKKVTELVMATFTTDTVIDFGFSVIRHLKSLVFDYEYIFQPEQESIFVEMPNS